MAVQDRITNLESWRRFTLLDALLVQASFGVSFSLARAVAPAEAGGIEHVVVGAVWGLVLAGPVVLMTQWTVRHRSGGLSAGEWLWLAPTALFALLWFAVNGPGARHPLLGHYLFWFWLFAQVTCMGVAVPTLFSGWRGYRSRVPCYWTDRTGTCVSLLFGVWTFLFALPFVLTG
jgi:hypothetical protein